MFILEKAKKFFKPGDPVEKFYDRLEELTKGVTTSSVSKAWGVYHPGDLLDQDDLRKEVHEAILTRNSKGPELFEKYVFPVSELMDPQGSHIPEFLKCCWIHEIGRLIEFSKGIVIEEEVADLVLDGVETSEVLEAHLKAYLLGQSMAKRALLEEEDPGEESEEIAAEMESDSEEEFDSENKILDIQDFKDTEIIEVDPHILFEPQELREVG